MPKEKDKKRDKYLYHLYLSESCPCCNYTEGHVYKRGDEYLPNYAGEASFKTKKELLKYAKENNIELDI